VTISNNNVVGIGSGDTIGTSTTGIFVGGVPTGTAVISGNTLLGQFGSAIAITQANGVSIKANHISGAQAGVALQEAQGTLIQGNIINTSYSGVVIGDNGLVGNNVVTKNTINEAACGIFKAFNSFGDTISPNAFFNVVTNICQ
jgi:hypothetical protein